MSLPKEWWISRGVILHMLWGSVGKSVHPIFQMCIRDRYRSLVHNMVVGVSEGYKKELELVGVGSVSYTHLDVYKRQTSAYAQTYLYCEPFDFRK